MDHRSPGNRGTAGNGAGMRGKGGSASAGIARARPATTASCGLSGLIGKTARDSTPHASPILPRRAPVSGLVTG
jgi:hypothetical protein